MPCAKPFIKQVKKVKPHVLLGLSGVVAYLLKRGGISPYMEFLVQGSILFTFYLVVNLASLRTRLAKSHDEHFDRGCKSKPDFYIEMIFNLTALYIQRQNCQTF